MCILNTGANVPSAGLLKRWLPECLVYVVLVSWEIKVSKTFFNDIEEETTGDYIFMWISSKARIWNRG